MKRGDNEVAAVQEAASEVIEKQLGYTAFPRRVGLPMREVWAMQPRFKKRTGVAPSRIVAHPRFRAAYDFLLLRAETGHADTELAEWWTKYQDANQAEQKKMTGGIRRRPTRRRRRRNAVPANDQ